MSELGDVIGQIVASGEATHDELGFSEKEARLMADKYLLVTSRVLIFAYHVTSYGDCLQTIGKRSNAATNGCDIK